MKSSMNYLPLVLLTASLSLPACRKDDTPPKGPPCSAENSRLQTRRVVLGMTDSTMSYDASGLRTTMRSAGTDSVIETISGGQTNYHIFNSAGDHIRTRQAFAGGGAVKPYYVDFFYEYDGAHQMIRSWTHVFDSNTFTDGWARQDSTGYTWQDGNMIQARDLVSGKTTAYSYYPGTNGRNPENVPESASRWLYRKGSAVVLSKNYVRRIGESREYTPAFDEQGRLTQVEIAAGGTVGKYFFTYVCR